MLRETNFLLSPQGWTANGWMSDAELRKPLQAEALHFMILLMLLWSISCECVPSICESHLASSFLQTVLSLALTFMKTDDHLFFLIR